MKNIEFIYYDDKWLDITTNDSYHCIMLPSNMKDSFISFLENNIHSMKIDDEAQLNIKTNNIEYVVFLTRTTKKRYNLHFTTSCFSIIYNFYIKKILELIKAIKG